MFGTLVVCLPCPHEGGDLVVKHCGRTWTFKTSEHPEGSVAAWYSDVSHEVLPVTSGYRVVLTYNLAIDPARPRPSASIQAADYQNLRRTLDRWLSRGVAGEHDATDHVYYRLDHEYTEANVSLAALKARDFSLVHALRDLSAELDFDVFLAALERRDEGTVGYDDSYHRRKDSRFYEEDYDEDDESEEDWHDLDEVLESEQRVKVLVQLDGRPVLHDALLDQEHVLKGESCFDEAEEEEDYDGYMGNSVGKACA